VPVIRQGTISESGRTICGTDTIKTTTLLALPKNYFLAFAISDFAFKEKTDGIPPAK
jgi:hypothetical protein